MRRRATTRATRAARATTVAAVLAAALPLAACGSGDAGGAGKGDKKVEVGVVVPALTIKAIADLAKGVEDRAQERGDAHVSVFGSTNESELVAKAENFITKHVDALVMDPLSVPAMRPVLVKAAEAKIPVILTVSDVPGKKASVLVADEVDGAKQVGAYVRKKLSDKGEVALVTGTSTDAVNQFRMDGFKQAISGSSGISVVASPEGKWDRPTALARSENVLTAHPNLDAFFVFNDDMAFGAASALKSRKSHALLVGYNGASDGLGAVWSGDFDATVMLRLYGIGRKALDYAVDAARGKPVPARVETKPLLVDKTAMQQIMDGTQTVPSDVKTSVENATKGS